MNYYELAKATKDAESVSARLLLNNGLPYPDATALAANRQADQYPGASALVGATVETATLYDSTGGSWVARGSGGGGGSTTVVDNLASTSATSALSAKQGKVLNDGKQAKTTVTPGTAMTSRALTDADDGGRFTVTGTITITPHANPTNPEFYAYFSGSGVLAFTEAGGVLVNEKRQVVTFTGEQTPVATLIYMGGNVYDLVGNKA